MWLICKLTDGNMELLPNLDIIAQIMAASLNQYHRVTFCLSQMTNDFYFIGGCL